MKISQLFCYPIKSLGGVPLESGTLTDRGFVADRRWMIVRPDGTFLTQREIPEMTQLEVSLSDSGLTVSHRRKNLGELEVPLEIPTDPQQLEVSIWRDTCRTIRVGKSADAWLESALQVPCHLVYMPDETHRQIETDYAAAGKWVSFADGYPYLILGEESLGLLNEKLTSPVTVSRFRPNIVFTGGTAHEEDTWRDVHIGDCDFQAIKPCARCKIPTLDPTTGQLGHEPSRTLATYRRTHGKILFGMNLIGPASGIIRVGNEVSGV